MSGSQPMHFVPTLAPEELARANIYALLARLFFAPPDRALLEALATADALPSDDASAALALAWKNLSHAAASADAEAVREEYETHFVGTGKAPISVYTSAYTVKTAVDNPLVDIRGFMAEQGLERKQDAHEPEDHVAALFEIMRLLVAVQQAPLDRQSGFFNTFIAVGGMLLCSAIERHPGTAFYKLVGRLAAAFIELEQATMDMH